jgi:hypothetical protein
MECRHYVALLGKRFSTDTQGSQGFFILSSSRPLRLSGKPQVLWRLATGSSKPCFPQAPRLRISTLNLEHGALNFAPA